MDGKTVKKVIEQLQKFPQDAPVRIFDWRKNLGDQSGEGSSEGIYDFEINQVKFSDDEKEYMKEMGYSFKTFIELSFSNDDYDDNGKNLFENE